LSVLLPFLKQGLARGERCLYIGDAPPDGAGFDALVQGGLTVLGTSDAYLKDGRFDLERMLEQFRELSAATRRDGRAALRVAGDASLVLNGAAGTERFFEYESRANGLFSDIEALALCLYDRRLFSPKHLRTVLRTHPLVIHRGAICRNRVYEPTAEFLAAEWTDAGIDRRLDEMHRAQMLEALTSAPEQAFHEQRLGAIGRLAGGIAHEFNNILTGILGLAEFVEEDLPPDSASRPDIREIKSLGLRASTLANQLLYFSQRRHSQPLRLELSSAVESFASGLRPTLGGDVSLSLAQGDRELFIEADPRALEIILGNLAENACQAMPNGGKIEIGVEAVTLSRPGAESKEWALLSVMDTGKGMSPEVQGFIFDPFFSVDGVSPSSGLGLSAVYGLVRQNGGFIEVRSAPGQGATFRIYFPLLPPPRPAAR